VREGFLPDKNRALFCFYFGLFPKSTSYQRIDYTFLTLLGDIGGLADALLLICMSIVAFFTAFHIDLKVIDTFECLIDFDPTKPG
jgi:hypothetical protein